MKELYELIQNGLVIRDGYSDKIDFLGSISDWLIENEYVIPQYKEEIIKRELEFPTGLVTRSINVSIPHSEAEFVLREAIVIAIPPGGIKFCRMDIPDEEIDVEVSFVLLLKDKNRHLAVLQQLAGLLQSENLHKIRDCASKEDIEEFIRGMELND